jgi:hypothetical protein
MKIYISMMTPIATAMSLMILTHVMHSWKVPKNAPRNGFILMSKKAPRNGFILVKVKLK